METREKLFYQFQKEFDKKRKRSLIALIPEIPIWLCLIYLLSKISVFIVKAHFRGDFIDDSLGLEIFMILMTACLLLLLIAIIVLPHQFFLSGYNKKSLMKETVSKLDTLAKKKKSLETKAEPSKERFLDTLAFSNWMCSPEIAVLVMGNWNNYVGEIVSDSEQDISSQQKAIDAVVKYIQEAEIRLDVYSSVPEKNFWQYLKSKKWLKKIN
jgi:hypothetical protein